jgi:hypothetical protein
MATRKRLFVEETSPRKYVARCKTAVAIPLSQQSFEPIRAPTEDDYRKIEERFGLLEAISEQIPNDFYFHWFPEDFSTDLVTECMRIRFDHPEYVDFLCALLSPEADKIFDETKSVRSALLFVALYSQLSVWKCGEGKPEWTVSDLSRWSYFERKFDWIEELVWPVLPPSTEPSQ